MVLLILVLAFVGSRMVEENPPARRFGWRCAGAAFVSYGVYAGCTQEPVTAQEWFSVSLRGLLASGLFLCLGWIGASVIVFIFRGLPRPAPRRPQPRPRPPIPPKVVYVREPLPQPTREDCIAAENAEHKKKLEIIVASIPDEDVRNAMEDEERARHAETIRHLLEQW